MTTPEAPEMPQTATRCGFVALIGAPNAGKSTLINKLVGTKVAIVSHKVQTTRATVRGIVMAGSAQIIFVDTPGIFRPKRRLERAMVETAWGGARDADVVALLIDAAAGIGDDARALIASLADLGRPKVLLLNKIDLVPRDSLLALVDTANKLVSFERTFLISALTASFFTGVLLTAMKKGSSFPAPSTTGTAGTL